jgi:predicted transcriptional regulator
MPRPYSSDLRTRVLAALKNSSEPRGEITRRFQLAPATLYFRLRKLSRLSCSS